MRKLFLVAKHEYRRMVWRRSFLLGTLAVPALLGAVMGVSVLLVLRGGSDAPLGYVDHAGILRPDVAVPEPDRPRPQGIGTEIVPYPDEETARAALEAEELQAYVVIAPDYATTGELELVYWADMPGEEARDDFEDFMLANLVDDLPDQVGARLFNGPNVTVRSSDGSREISQAGMFNLFLPYFAGLFFIMAANSAAQYLMRAVADEKENRTVEVLVTSLTPEQLIGGKAIGLISVALTQLLIWAVATAVAVILGSSYIDFLGGVEMPWDFIIISAVYFLPSFALMAGMMIAVGSTVTEYREGQQVASIFSLLFTLPYFLLPIIIESPNSPATTLLTLFPSTSYVTMTVRWSMSSIPTWQILTSLALLIATAVAVIWAASRIFRAGMLRYGQRLRLAGVIAAVRRR
jgi:ABC-2 type transport system permease protein